MIYSLVSSSERQFQPVATDASGAGPADSNDHAVGLAVRALAGRDEAELHAARQELQAINSADEGVRTAVQHNLAVLEIALGRPAEAVTAAGRAVAVRRRLAAADVRWRQQLAASLNVLAAGYVDLGEFRLAWPIVSDWVGVLRTIVADEPAERVRLAGALNLLGAVLARVSQLEDAVVAAVESVSVLRRAGALPELAAALANLANHHADLGRLAAANAAAREAAELYRSLGEGYASQRDVVEANLARYDTSQRADRVDVHIIDTHPLYQAALARDLGGRPDVRIGVVARSVANFEARRPAPGAIVILKMEVDDAAAVAVVVELGFRVLVVSADGRRETMLAAVAAGAQGCLTRDADSAEIHRAVSEVSAGNPVVAPAVLHHLFDALRRAGALADLTNREREVLSLVAAGHDDDHITTHLAISASTLRTYLARIEEKLRQKRTAQLAARSRSALAP